MVAFLPLYFKLECFDKFPKAEVKWSFVLKWVTWRINAQKSAIHFPIWKESPQLSCPLRAPQRGDWLSTDGRKAWQSMPKESSLGGRGLWMSKHWQYPLAHSLPVLLHVRPVGNWTERITQNPWSVYFSHIRAKPLHFVQPTEMGTLTLTT